MGANNFNSASEEVSRMKSSVKSTQFIRRLQKPRILTRLKNSTSMLVAACATIAGSNMIGTAVHATENIELYDTIDEKIIETAPSVAKNDEKVDISNGLSSSNGRDINDEVVDRSLKDVESGDNSINGHDSLQEVENNAELQEALYNNNNDGDLSSNDLASNNRLEITSDGEIRALQGGMASLYEEGDCACTQDDGKCYKPLCPNG